MKKILSVFALAVCCGTASATTYNIISVHNGTDNGFGFSGFHYAGEGGSGVDNDGNPMTGSALAGIDTTPVSGTYNDVSGALDMVLTLNGGGTGTVTLSGTNFFFAAADPFALTAVRSLSAVFSNPTTSLFNTDIVFDNSIVCCGGANPAPNAFNGVLMSLWGADFNIPGTAGPLLGLDLRIELEPVPVPAAVWLFGSGLLGLVGVARRRQLS